jgi:hypothetical protein
MFQFFNQRLKRLEKEMTTLRADLDAAIANAPTAVANQVVSDLQASFESLISVIQAGEATQDYTQEISAINNLPVTISTAVQTAVQQQLTAAGIVVPPPTTPPSS